MAASVVRGAELPGKRKCAAASLDLSSLLFLALALATLATPSTAAVYKVGDSAGWTTLGNVNYSAWAASKTFLVGDTILFQYNKQFHNVEVVSEADYKSCSAKSPQATYTTGNDSIALKTAGHHFFLCGVPGHCNIGQKVDVNVLKGASAPAPAGTAPSASPGPSSSAPPTPSAAGGGLAGPGTVGVAPAPQQNRAAPGAAGNYARGWAVALLAVAVGASLS